MSQSVKTNLQKQTVFVARLGMIVACVVWITAAARTAADDVLLGWDLFVTPAPTQATSSWNFASNPLPAGFFDPGSDPFSGTVQFQGEPLGPTYGPVGPTDTIVERKETAFLPGVGSSDTVPIEIVALNLVSIQPITVTYGPNPPEQWDVRLSLTNSPTGTMMISHTVAEGGVFASFFTVQPKLTFTRHGDLAERDTNRIDNLTQTSSVQWSHDAPHDAVTVPETSNFFPGGTPGDSFGPVQQFRYQGSQFTWDLQLTIVPEPSTVLLLMAGLAIFLLVTRRFK
jgi:hypothetical protein